MSERLALSVAEAASELGCSERMVRSMVSRKEIPHVRIGRRVVLPTHLLREWLEDRVLPSQKEEGEGSRANEGAEQEAEGGKNTRNRQR